MDWYPWGEEALARAKAEDKPILPSIGNSASYWCPVMAHESFEDETTAALMNEHFINLKVDRKERPDLDFIHMAAARALNLGPGGWPMTVFLTPDRCPFLAGTYLPPELRYGRSSFSQLVEQVASLWQDDRGKLLHQAQAVTNNLEAALRPGSPRALGETELKIALEQYKARFDPLHGGLGGALKFPPAVGLSLLLKLHHHFGDVMGLEMVTTTLEAMVRGGIYDHIGGGFCRYSTDEKGLVPYFEKMLYDNALLAKTYQEAFQVTGKELFEKVATETLDHILRETTGPEGALFSATDAKPEGQEGKFLVWDPEQIKEVLGPAETHLFCAYYDLTAQGNWEGRSIPHTPLSLEQVARDLIISPRELEASLDRCRPKLYRTRLQRVAPGLDDKILTAWNGLMLSAMAEDYQVLGHLRYLEAAERAVKFITTTMVDEQGNLLRTYRQGQAKLRAYLEDHAYLAEGLLDLDEAGGSVVWLFKARELTQLMLEDFQDPRSGAFYTTARDTDQLILRHMEGHDGATPSANAVAASALARLFYHFEDPDLRQTASRSLKAHGTHLMQNPTAFARSLIVLDLQRQGPVELVLVGTPGEDGYEALRAAIQNSYLPHRLVAHHDPRVDGSLARSEAGPPTSLPNTLPLLVDRGFIEGQAALDICSA